MQNACEESRKRLLQFLLRKDLKKEIPFPNFGRTLSLRPKSHFQYLDKAELPHPIFTHAFSASEQPHFIYAGNLFTMWKTHV